MFKNTKKAMLLGIATTSMVYAESYAQNTINQFDDITYDEIRVLSSPLNTPEFNLLSTVNIIERAKIETYLTDNIGDLVSKYPGVDNASMGQAVGRPVIRGQSDYRVAVLENGFSAGDVSSTAADHSNMVSLLDTQRVEVLKGPVALRYGPYVSSGVVNLLDVHMNTDMKPVSQLDLMESFSDMTDEKTVAFLGRQSFLMGDVRGILAVSGRFIDKDAYEIPGTVESIALLNDEGEDIDEAERGLAENTDIEEEGGTISLNLGSDDSQLSLMFSTMTREYGLVGHHAHEEHDDDEDEDHEGEEHEEEAGPRIDMEREVFTGRYTRAMNGLLNRFSIGFSSTDYEHTEGEGGTIGSTYKLSDAYATEIEANLNIHKDLDSMVGISISEETLEVSGEETFLPETDSTKQAFYTFNNYEISDWIFEVSARHDEIEYETATNAYDESADSLAAGVAYKTPYAGIIGATIASTQRLPSVSELYSNGVHFAAQRNEIGDTSLSKEKSEMAEIYFRQKLSFGGFTISYYDNSVDDYIYLNPTGTVDAEDMPIFNFIQSDAEFKGGEFTIYWNDINIGQAVMNADISVDQVRGSLSSGGALPTIPPMKIVASADFAYRNFDFGTVITKAMEQKRIASYELPTDEFTQIDLEIGWTPNALKDGRVSLLAKNITDEEVRRHASPFKDRVSEPGTDIALRLHLTF